jgi:hypothetical protein
MTMVFVAIHAQTIAVKTNLLYDATTTINLGLEAAVAPKWTIELPINYNPWEFPKERLVLADMPSNSGKLLYEYDNGTVGESPNPSELFHPDGTRVRTRTKSVTRKFKHWMIQPEARYWFCEKFNGHFFGIHFLVAGYNIGGINTFGLGSLYGMGDVKDFDYQYPVPLMPDKENHPVAWEDWNKLYKDYVDYRYEGLAYGGGISYGYHWILNARLSIEATLGIGYIYQDYKKYDCPVCGKQIETVQQGRIAPTKAGISLIYIIK